MVKKTIDWHMVDTTLTGLATDEKHEISIQREAIPIIFVPGVMGSKLSRKGKKVKDSENGLPNLRWDTKTKWILSNYSTATPARRKMMLIGKSFDSDYLDVPADPQGDGWDGLIDDYKIVREALRTHDWGALNKIFVFPVYAFGYNWTDSSDKNGEDLAKRIEKIIDEAQYIMGSKNSCEKVILVSHSMGGLVARSASKLHGAEKRILGIVHGVQPAFGSAAAYWRIKAGFEGGWGLKATAHCLGANGAAVTALLGNSIGGLELLPSKSYRTNTGSSIWLTITHNGKTILSLPENSDPYSSIYSIPAVVNPTSHSLPSNNAFWGLVDPNLLTPEVTPPTVIAIGLDGASAVIDYNDVEYKAQKMFSNDVAWTNYLSNLEKAEKLHDKLDGYIHPKTWRFHGAGCKTSESIELKIESNWTQVENYPTQGFRGFFRDSKGSSMQAILKDPAGDGDGTVPISSATFMGNWDKVENLGPPDNHEFASLEHQPAYDSNEVNRWMFCAIKALVKQHFIQKRGSK